MVILYWFAFENTIFYLLFFSPQQYIYLLIILEMFLVINFLVD